MDTLNTKGPVLICLLGHPVAHSISPKMHNLAFAKLGLSYAYVTYDVTPEQLPDILDTLKALGCRGLNLTMPLKTAILPYLDKMSRTVRLSGSANTVVFEDGKLIGHTTDGAGYMRSLKDAGFDIIGQSMTLLGAGGAAASICAQAALDGVASITILKRKNATFPQAESFAASVQKATGCRVQVMDIADESAMKKSIAESKILVNATNVGMGTDDTSLVPKEYLHKDLIVSDIIYHPAATRLLKDAAACGCSTINGTYMLLFQGAAAFRLWTGKKMPVKDIKEAGFMKKLIL